MALFDPPHEKIIGWSPEAFRQPARRVVPVIDAALRDHGIPDSGRKLFRTAVIGRLALHHLQTSDERISPRHQQFIQVYAGNAERGIPLRFQHLVGTIAQAAYDALNVKPTDA